MAEHSLLNTTFPVLLPDMPEIRLEKLDYLERMRSVVDQYKSAKGLQVQALQDASELDKAETDTIKSKDVKVEVAQQKVTEGPFMTGLLADKSAVPSLDDRDGKMLTENADVAYSTSGQALVDLFYELEDVISATRLKEVLEKAWQNDADATLRIIWNARSIHLGKSSRSTFYRAVGWLAENHPMTLITNLPWLVRPVIQKKTSKETKKEGKVAKDSEMVEDNNADSDFELIDEQSAEPELKKLKLDEDALEDDEELAEFDIKYGVAHGYWKDLLNILALAANDELKVDGDPRKVLNVDKPSRKKKYLRDWTEGRKKATITERHNRTVAKLETDSFYKALHTSVARLFAFQLHLDASRLQSGKKVEMKGITFAAKWAPTHKGMHDQHTFIVSTIAEILHPFESVCPEGVDSADRELYLKHARIAYQSQILSPLRKHLEIVERPITAEKFEEIKYERVPSLAMKRYNRLFAEKDFERFDQYIERVAAGRSRISGATLLPSTMVGNVLGLNSLQTGKSTNAMVDRKMEEMQLKVIDGQWNTLVQRIKDSGTLESSIAVCDVSGSMGGPRFPDGTNPMCSSIGLSLLIAEVTKPPFGGAFITFSEKPEVVRAGGSDDKRSFAEKVKFIKRSNWGANTDFAAVFEKLILPMAVRNKLTQEDMVKQLFVFSDMQFDAAHSKNVRWESSYERIQVQFKKAGYEMPRLIFWNLAGGRGGYAYGDTKTGNEIASKPVTAAEENTALVSGYSQGQVKMFLEGGGFEEPEEEIVEEEEEGEDGEEGEVIVKKQKKKQDPLAVVRKAISHEAYSMLKVVD